MEPFVFMLAGGHPNSLGRTVEVVGCVLDQPERLDELFDCYKCDDAVVRLRTSSVLKRLFAARPEWVAEYADRLFGDMAALDQPSAKWTTAQVFLAHSGMLTPEQIERATGILVRNLHEEQDWIALNMTMKTLQAWLKSQPDLGTRIMQRVTELADDPRRSVANGARKVLKEMAKSPL